MRINSSSDNDRQQEQQSKVTTNRPATQPTEPNENINISQTGSQTFASVLDRVAKPKDKERDKDFKESDKAQSKETEESEETEETEDSLQPLYEEAKRSKREKSNSNDSGNGFGQMNNGVNETFNAAPSDAVSARAILHIADLERIVSAIRTKIQTGVQSEVLIELKNSVLDGLKIRLSANGENHISAEFIAATERVRAQLDTRLSDLSDLLRSRGVTLAELKTSLSSGQSNDGNYGSGGNSDISNNAPSQNRIEADNYSQNTDAPSANYEDDIGATYRA